MFVFCDEVQGPARCRHQAHVRCLVGGVRRDHLICIRDLFEIVQDKQRASFTEEALDPRTRKFLHLSSRVQGVRDPCPHQGCPICSLQICEEHTVAELSFHTGCERHGKARLPRATRASQRDQPG